MKKVIVNFPENQFFKESFSKNQVFLHHTVSGPGAMGDINYWISTPDKVGTAIVLDRDGTVYQCYDEQYWAYHLGLQLKTFEINKVTYKSLDKTSIGIEIDCWGGLVKDETDNTWHPALWDVTTAKYVPNKKVAAIKNVQEYEKGYRGFYGFEKYTPEQIQTVKELLLSYKERFKIDLTYNDDIFDVNLRALKGENGVFTHTSVRYDKSDIHPQPEMIAMLKTLKA